MISFSECDLELKMKLLKLLFRVKCFEATLLMKGRI